MKKQKLTLLIALSIIIILIAIFSNTIQASGTIADTPVETVVTPEEPELLTTDLVAKEVIMGKWGVTAEEVNIRLFLAGYDCIEVNTQVDNLVPDVILIERKLPSKASTFKSWMPYTAITNRSSPQYKLQKKAYTDENGLRKIGEDYCVAMGTFYSSTIGDRFQITMSSGITFTVIISDVKSDRHTDSTHRYTVSNGCVMEFLVDKRKLNPIIKQSGNVGSLEFFSGKFSKIEKIS